MEMNFQEMKNWLEKNRLSGMPTGYTALNSLVDSFPNGSLTVIGARPAMGRYSLALNLANRIARLSKRSIAIISTRYDRGSTANRILKLGVGVDMATVLQEPDTPVLEKLSKYLSAQKAGIHVMEDVWKDLDTIELFCERIPNLGLVIVDGIEALYDSGAYPDPDKYMEEQPITRQNAVLWLKKLAQQWNVSVICTVHLAPDLEEWENRRPNLEALELTGVSPETADTILFFYRDSYYDYRSRDNLAELIVAKSCTGREGTAYLRWDCQTCTIGEFE